MSKKEPKFKRGDMVILKKEREYAYSDNPQPEKPMKIRGDATRPSDTDKWWVMENDHHHRYREADMEPYQKCRLKRRRKK